MMGRKMFCAVLAICGMLVLQFGANAQGTTAKGNPAQRLFGDDLAMLVSFDDGKGEADIMDGEIEVNAGKSKNPQFAEEGAWGKCFSDGSLSYKTKFENVDFGKPCTFAFWMALATDDPAFDKLGACMPVALCPARDGAFLQLQRQGWTKCANLFTSLSVPGKKTNNTMARIFGISKTTQWKKGEWHLVAITWTPEELGLCVDGIHYTVAALPSSIPKIFELSDNPGIDGLWLGVSPKDLKLDELMFFSRKLSKDEIQKLYQESLKNMQMERNTK